MKKIFRKILLFTAALLCFNSVFSQMNSSFEPGKLWKDTNGRHINAHGGGILYDKGTYYWFGEYKGETNLAEKGITCYSSKDLYNWKNEGIVLEVSENPNSQIAKGCIMERPKVIYNKKTGCYVLWFHLELKGQGYEAARTAVATSRNAAGPYKFIRSYRPNVGNWPIGFREEWKKKIPGEDTLKSWTPKWKEAVSQGYYIRQHMAIGQTARDMQLFVDDNGKAYHIHASEDNLTLHVSELTDDFLDFTDKYAIIEPGGHNEAPAIFKKDGIYYLITSGCTGWEPNAARSFRSAGIWGPWEALGNPCEGDGSETTFESQSTYVLPVAGSNNGFIFMADRWRPKDPKDGRYVWLPLTIEKQRPILRWKNQWRLEDLKK